MLAARYVHNLRMAEILTPEEHWLVTQHEREVDSLSYADDEVGAGVAHQVRQYMLHNFEDDLDQVQGNFNRWFHIKGSGVTSSYHALKAFAYVNINPKCAKKWKPLEHTVAYQWSADADNEEEG